MATKYTAQEITTALAENKKPEGMSNAYWYKLKKGLAGKGYGIEQSEKPANEEKVCDASEDSTTSEESQESCDCPTTVVQADGSVQVFGSSAV